MRKKRFVIKRVTLTSLGKMSDTFVLHKEFLNILLFYL
nr:MAG TPA_asm: hypothetical protein [Caudoviricetes sp.]